MKTAHSPSSVPPPHYPRKHRKKLKNAPVQNDKNLPQAPGISRICWNGTSFQYLNPIFSCVGAPPEVTTKAARMRPRMVRILMAENQNSTWDGERSIWLVKRGSRRERGREEEREEIEAKGEREGEQEGEERDVPLRMSQLRRSWCWRPPQWTP
jgi:hypothetical protein